jgi:hypothetical protein
MDVINSTELNFSKSAVTHFVKMLDERGKGKGIVGLLQQGSRRSKQRGIGEGPGA